MIVFNLLVMSFSVLLSRMYFIIIIFFSLFAWSTCIVHQYRPAKQPTRLDKPLDGLLLGPCIMSWYCEAGEVTLVTNEDSQDYQDAGIRHLLTHEITRMLGCWDQTLAEA